MQKLQINIGDSVVFSQRYLIDEHHQAHLYGKSGKVLRKCEDEEHVMVEFDFAPNKLHKIFIEDLELLLNKEEDEDGDLIPLDDLTDYEDHDLGGMSRAQLIAQKLLAQEADPGLDRSINNLIN